MKRHQVFSVGSSSSHAINLEEETTEEEEEEISYNEIESDKKKRKTINNKTTSNSDESHDILLDSDDNEYYEVINKKTEMLEEAIKKRNDLFEYSKNIVLDHIKLKHNETLEAEEGEERALNDIPPLDFTSAFKAVNDTVSKVQLQNERIEKLLNDCERIKNKKKNQLENKKKGHDDGSN
ncbi:hypothetical protein ABK040_011649 [Willaertia magna]